MAHARHSPSRSPRRRRLFAGATLSLGILLAAAQPACAFHPHHDIKHQVEQLEEQWRTAQLAGDVSTMDKMLADDYVGITMSGQVATKSQQLNRIRSHAFVLTRLDLEEMKVKLVGPVAIVTVHARVEGTSEGARVDGEYRYTRIYDRLPNGAWKITNFEATRIRPLPPRSEQAAPAATKESGGPGWRSAAKKILPGFRQSA